MTTCGFDMGWGGVCDEAKPCKRHDDLVCIECGKKAVRSCPAAGSVTCGAPLCGDCECRSYLCGHSRYQLEDLWKIKNETPKAFGWFMYIRPTEDGPKKKWKCWGKDESAIADDAALCVVKYNIQKEMFRRGWRVEMYQGIWEVWVDQKGTRFQTFTSAVEHLSQQIKESPNA